MGSFPDPGGGDPGHVHLGLHEISQNQASKTFSHAQNYWIYIDKILEIHQANFGELIWTTFGDFGLWKLLVDFCTRFLPAILEFWSHCCYHM